MSGNTVYSDPHVLRRDDPGRKARRGLDYALSTPLAGNWTDDRYKQSFAAKDDVYVALQARADALVGAFAQITQLRRNAELRKMGQKAFVFKSLSPHSQAHNEQRKPVTRGPLVDLFRRPNPRDTLASFLAKWDMQELLTGNVIVWLQRNNAGSVVRMHVLPTALCRPIPPGAEYPRGGYWVQPQYAGGMPALTPWGLGIGARIPMQDTLRYMRPHPVYLWDGYSPLTAGSKWVDILESIDHAFWSEMDTGWNRGTTVVVPGLSPDEATEQEERINRLKGGARNARRTTIIGNQNPSAAPPEIHDPPPPSDMQYQQGREVYSSKLMHMLGVPSGIVAADADGYAAFYARLKQFYTLKLVPWLTKVAAELTAHVVSTWDDGDDGLELELALPPLVNEEAEEGKKQRQQQNGVTTANMDRLADDLPPWDDPKADVLPTSLFNEYLKAKHMPAPPEPAPGEDDPLAQSADDLLAGLGGDGGPEDGDDAPRPDNPAGAGSLPPQVKALVRKAAGARRREGEVWRGESGHYFTLSGGHVVPAKAPGGADAGAGATGPRPDAGKVPPAVGEVLAAPSSGDPAALAAALKKLAPGDLAAAKKAAGFAGGTVAGGTVAGGTAAAFLSHVKAGGAGPPPKKTEAAGADRHPAATGLHAAVEAADLPGETTAAYKAHIDAVTASMPKRALDRIGKHLRGGAKFYGSAKDVGLGAVGAGLALPNLTPEARASLERTRAEIENGELEIRGSVTSSGGASQLHLDGDFASHGGEAGAYQGAGQTARDIYAHELTHAIDGPAFELSSSWQWAVAYDKEIGPAAGEPRLTRYAHANKSEGFAEFGRLVYGGAVPLAEVQKLFPEATKFFKARKLWPS